MPWQLTAPPAVPQPRGGAQRSGAAEGVVREAARCALMKRAAMTGRETGLSSFRPDADCTWAMRPAQGGRRAGDRRHDSHELPRRRMPQYSPERTACSGLPASRAPGSAPRGGLDRQLIRAAVVRAVHDHGASAAHAHAASLPRRDTDRTRDLRCLSRRLPERAPRRCRIYGAARTRARHASRCAPRAVVPRRRWLCRWVRRRGSPGRPTAQGGPGPRTGRACTSRTRAANSHQRRHTRSVW